MVTTTGTHSDHAVQKAVSEELNWTPDVDAAHIGVSVTDGTVTLTGEVASSAERIAAKNAALRVRGVTAVADDLTVHQAGHNKPTDTDIAVAVQNALEWSSTVPPGKVKAEVRDYVVILTGTVDWNFQRQAARKAVEHLHGVRSVDSQIHLARKPSAMDTEELIRNALIRHAVLDGSKINVSIEGTEATLTGTVSSWAEKEQAGDAAWASPNVSIVHNNIVVHTV